MTEALVEPTLDRIRGRTGVKWSDHADTDVLSAWVADMDFDAPAAALDAIRALVDSGSTGYGNWPVPPMLEAFCDWQAESFGWRPDIERTREFTSVLHAVEIALWLRSEPGDGVVVFMPIYHPFLGAIDNSGRRRIEVPLDLDGWRLDPDRLRAAIDDTTRIVLLCQPHNPTGRQFDEHELTALAEVVDEHDLLVISDEIWGDLTYENPHRPLALVDERFHGRLITCASASKTFNLAGTRVSAAHIDDAVLWEKFATMPSHALGGASTFGIAAATACWRRGRPWLDQLRVQLRRNRDHLAARLADEAPSIGFDPPEATYLAWLDFSRTSIADSPVDALLAGGLKLSPGAQFGDAGATFARLNFATSEEMLDRLIDRIVAAIG